METNEGRADAMGIMSEVTEAAAGMLPLDLVNALAELVDPAAVAKGNALAGRGDGEDRAR